MKAKTMIPSLGALAVVSLLVASPAQACMSFFSSGPGIAACPSAQVQRVPQAPMIPQAQATPQAQPEACLLPGDTANPSPLCGLVNPELMAALGDMAAGGMQIATHMMRVLAEEVSRYATLGEGVR